MRVVRWFSVVSLVALLLSACAQKDITATEIMKRVQDARAKTKDAHATLDVSMTGSRQDGQFTVETWMVRSTKLDPTGQPISMTHTTVLKSSRAEMQGSEIINDGTTVWIYSPKQNQVIRSDLSELNSGGVGAQDPTAQLQRMQAMLKQILDGSNVTILSKNEPVAGRNAWKLKLTPKPETAQQMQLTSAVETTLWIDQQRDIPLKGLVNAADIGKIEGTVQQIELDKGIAPSVFTFTPPPGAKIVDAADLAKQARPQTTTLGDATKKASFKILTPQPLPVGVKLDEVQSATVGGESVIQQYSGITSYSLVQTKGQGRGFSQNDAPFGAKTEAVTVRGQQATLITGTADQKGTLLRWQENGVTIIIAGTLSRDQALTIATSLK